MRKKRAHEARIGTAVLTAALALAVAASAQAQETHAATGTEVEPGALSPNPETTLRERLFQDAGYEPGPLRKSDFGTRLTRAEAAALLQEMRSMTEEALAASRAAEQASDVAAVKSAASRVFEAVWGLPAGVGAEGGEALNVHGWKEYWQVTGGEFDPDFVKRYGANPPRITDPRQLGIAGRGRAVRGWIEGYVLDTSSQALLADRRAASLVLAPLNNVVGWTYITTGFKGKEVQPRISLTHLWDAPAEFWNSTADTGWLYEAYSQAANILKTDYAGDAAEARRHAADLSRLLEKSLRGVDADKDGVVEAAPMEGGLDAALGAARAGLRAN